MGMKHGETVGRVQSAEYQVWAGMVGRCTNPTNTAYHEYGLRGVKVCDRWAKSFTNFLLDMGRRPTSKHSIDRIKNERGYEPGNCRWATAREQARNRSSNRLLTFKGETMCSTAWAERFGWKSNVIHDRLRLGWSVEEALTTPLKKRTQSPKPPALS